jgi:hypothetical protein
MNIPLRLILIALLPMAAADVSSANDDQTETVPGSNHRPATPQPVAVADLEAALQRGVDYLVANQNKDGSWGSPALKGGVPIIAGIGSHHAYQVAVTAMSVSALIESGAQSPSVAEAIERGEKHLLDQLPLVRRDNPMLIYNVWTHAYGIQALVRMYARLPDDAPRRERIRELIQRQYEKLTKYESAEGGWGYYDFDANGSTVGLAGALTARRVDCVAERQILERLLGGGAALFVPDSLYGFATKRNLTGRSGALTMRLTKAYCGPTQATLHSGPTAHKPLI